MFPDEVKSVKKHHAQINEIAKADISNASTHRFLSLACHDDKFLKDAIVSYIKKLYPLDTFEKKIEKEEADLLKFIKDRIDSTFLPRSRNIDQNVQTLNSNPEDANCIQKLRELNRGETYALTDLVGRINTISEKRDRIIEKKERYDTDKDELSAIADILVKHVKGITEKESSLKHKSTSHDKINTADYVISVCCTSHEFVSEKNTYGFNIHKKIVFATSKFNTKSSTPLNIPICEELVIQYMKPDSKGLKYSPTLTNDSSCLVISYMIDATKEGSVHDHTFHFFGENAFSLVFSKTHGVNSYLVHDIAKSCIRLAGALCKKMIDIHNSNDEERKKGFDFWGKIFDQDKYTQIEKSKETETLLINKKKKVRLCS
jgi:hypothetical protein